MVLACLCRMLSVATNSVVVPTSFIHIMSSFIAPGPCRVRRRQEAMYALHAQQRSLSISAALLHRIAFVTQSATPPASSSKPMASLRRPEGSH